MSTTSVSGGFCLICGTTVDEDFADHFAREHQRVAQKPNVPIKSWQDRLDGIVTAIEEIRQESDRAVQVRRLDKEVIQELYLVRARLAQMKRNNPKKKEGQT